MTEANGYEFPTLHVSSHPAILHKLALLRDETTKPPQFRQLVREISWLLGYEALLAARGNDLSIQILDGHSQLAMTAADVVLMTSGTTTLEALLLKKPMVVAYRMGAWSFALVKRLVKIKFMSLPNLLAGRELVPERLQQDVRADVLGPLLLERLDNQAMRAQLEHEFLLIHQALRRNASASRT